MTELAQQVDDRKETELVEQPDAFDTDLLDETDFAETEKQEDSGLLASIRSLFSWKNYSVYLTTSWVITSFSYLGLFLNLYLIDLEWEYVLIGAVLSVVSLASTMGRLVGGYVGDIVNRKHLAVAATFVLAAYNFVMGISTVFVIIFAALLLFSLVEVFKGGSTAFIMENIPKKHSGLGISLFSSTGRVFGVLILLALTLVVPMIGFGPSIRTFFFIGSILLVVAAIARAALLEGSKPREVEGRGRHIVEFFRENRRTAATIIKAAPGFLAVVMVDAISDSMFKFGTNIYIYEVVGINFEGIIVMTLSSTLLMIPLLLLTGRSSDRRGVTRSALLIYAFMPICAAILILAPMFPYWAPATIVSAAEGAFSGLGAIFSTPFVAVVMKSVNDALWYLILLTIIQKNLPGKDTSKILGAFWFIIYLSSSIAPYISGIIYQYINPQYLFVIVIILNIIIMGTISKRGLIREASLEELDGGNDGGQGHSNEDSQDSRKGLS
ncbi:MFS transporter [Candidatus Thorarchaeota archaeon]|nr:MAG: MFS transporter [Candidatus Thorarchaeota archaeon]